MLLEVLATFASVVLICWSCAIRPSVAQCPAGWYVEGIRVTGQYDCRPVPPPDPHDARGHEIDPPPRHDPQIDGQIYCPGSHPIVVDARTVGCQR